MHFVTTLLNVRNKKSHEWVTCVCFSSEKVGKKQTLQNLIWKAVVFSFSLSCILGLTSNVIKKNSFVCCVWWCLFGMISLMSDGVSSCTSPEPILSSPNWQNEHWSGGGVLSERIKKWQSGQPRGCGGLLLREAPPHNLHNKPHARAHTRGPIL